MKKILISLLALFIFGSVQAQGTFKIGLMGGVPTSDASDLSNLVLGADAYYMIGKKSALFRLGPTIGFRNFFGKEISEGFEFEDAQFLPIGAAARVNIIGIVNLGADLGYAVGITDGLDGGFYFRPVVALGLLQILELNFSYESISDAATWGNFNIGVLLVL